jgi:hypothetical protein
VTDGMDRVSRHVEAFNDSMRTGDCQRFTADATMTLTWDGDLATDLVVAFDD